MRWQRDIRLFWVISRPLNLALALLTFTQAAYLSAGRSWASLPRSAVLEGLLIVVIMAGGYWINDVYDFKIDRINKPRRAIVGAHLSRKKTLTGYLVTLFFVCMLSLELPFRLLIVNYLACGALYLYAAYLKQAAVVGNLVVATLTAAVVLAGALLVALHLALVWMALFAFLITFLREVTKDVEDIKGDILFGLRTLPILIGIRMTKRVLLVGYVLVAIACLLPFPVYYSLDGTLLWAYLITCILLVMIPLAYGVMLLRRAYRPRDFNRQSSLLKVVIVGGLATVLLLP